MLHPVSQRHTRGPYFHLECVLTKWGCQTHITNLLQHLPVPHMSYNPESPSLVDSKWFSIYMSSVSPALPCPAHALPCAALPCPAPWHWHSVQQSVTVTCAAGLLWVKPKALPKAPSSSNGTGTPLIDDSDIPILPEIEVCPDSLAQYATTTSLSLP